MTDTSKVLRFLERAAARAEGDDPDVPGEDETIRYTRDRLSEAAPFAHAGGDVPAGARLRPVKAALVGAMRPVTSNQRNFNEQLLAAVDGVAAAAEGLRHHLGLQDQRLARLQAGIASADLTLDDLNDDLRRLADQLDALAGELDGVRVDLAAVREAELAEVRQGLAEIRAKQDLIFRAARAALPDGGTDHLRELDAALATEQRTLRTRLDHALRGPREQVLDQLRPYLDDLAPVPGRGPVVDLGAGRGEWLELLRDAGIDGYGIDLDPEAADEGRARGLDIRTEDALDHLRGLPEGSVRAITAFHLADRLPLDTLVAVVDAALVALAPGGLLILEAANPTNLSVGAAAIWLDPSTHRPLHPQLLELVVLERGFGTAEVRFVHPSDGPALRADDLVGADDDPVRTAALVDRINWALGGPLAYAVLARTAAPTTG